MVSRMALEHLIARAEVRKSDWHNAEIDVTRIARRARAQHAAEVLIQLGYDQIAQELLRLERSSARADAAPATIQAPAA